MKTWSYMCVIIMYKDRENERVGKVGKEKLIVQPTRQECTGRDVIER